MQLKTTVRPIPIRRGQRLIAMSDIHGHAENLLGVLDKARFCEKDILVITGDIIDKGPESLRTLRIVRSLAEKGNVYCSMGNVDFSRLEILLDDTEQGAATFADFIHWRMSSCGGRSLLTDFLTETGVDPAAVTRENAAAMQKLLRERFAPEIDFLLSLPTILTAGDFIFVHGGVPTDDVESLAGTDAFPYLKNDRFYEKGNRFTRCVAVGHWPVKMYHTLVDHNPLIDAERRVICMDGSCGLDIAGQLNALIFPDAWAPMADITHVYEDSLPTVTALGAQEPTPQTLRIDWLNNEVECPRAEPNGLTLCRHVQTGREVRIPTQLIWEESGRFFAETYTDARLAVQPGDTLSVIWQDETLPLLYGKKDGVESWFLVRS